MPTDEQRALWTAIRAHSEEDTPRLVYADWLQEHGDETRAEFIRVQCNLARLPSDLRKARKQRALLLKREGELLKAHKKRWSTALCRALAGTSPAESQQVWLARLTYWRGFIRMLDLDLPAAVRLIASGLELEPVHFLAISRIQPAESYPDALVAEIALWKAGSWVTGLRLDGATDDDVSSFVIGGQLTNLRELAFMLGSVSDTAVALLANSPLLESVDFLRLNANLIGDDGALALARSPHLPRIRYLCLYSNSIGPKGRRALRERYGSAFYIEPEPV
jgi:uncharacterized protein (TIGR02996 family)